MIDVAYAMALPGGKGGGGDMNTLLGFLPMVLILGVFYFLLIRPQQKKAKEHRDLLENLKRGDAVITQGGLYGKIANISDQVVTLEIADKVRVRVSRGSIAGLAATSTTDDQNP
jgi:preprotein translocase subunit YajC